MQVGPGVETRAGKEIQQTASDPVFDNRLVSMWQILYKAFPMTSCRHLHLVLLPQPKGRLRCRHCHLTIAPDELSGGYCPECLEEQGVRRNDFEEVPATGQDKTRYQCEECGVIIEAE